MRPSKFTIGLVLVMILGIAGIYGALAAVSEPAATDEVATLGTETVIYDGSVTVNVSETLRAVAGLRGYDIVTPASVSIDPYTPVSDPILRFRVLGLESSLHPIQRGFRWRLSGSADTVIELNENLSTAAQRVALAGAAERIYQEQRTFSITAPRFQRARFLDYDAEWAARIVRQGAAVYVEQAFWAASDRPGREPIAFYRGVATRSEAAWRATAAERLGFEWVSERVDDVQALDAVYEDPPTTTAAILHPDRNWSYPTMRVRATNSSWTVDQRYRLGELVTRFVLRTELDGPRAERAAAGWVDDRLVEYLGGQDEQGFVWTVRLRNRSEATEFASAAAAYFDGRATSIGDGRWRGPDRQYKLLRPGAETVVLVYGPGAFVTETGASVGVNGTVTVSAPA